MSKKTYRTHSLKSLQLILKDEEGKRVEIRFRGGIQIDSTAKFTTKDKRIQALLEKCSGFGPDYYIESEIPDETDVPAPVEVKEEKVEKPKAEKPVLAEVKDSRRFRNLVEMKNAMSELGIELEEGANYAKAKAAANKAGYDFQIQK